MSNQDFVPVNDGKFVEWAKNLLENVKDNISAWGVPETAFDDVDKLVSDLSDCYVVAETPATRTSTAILAKNEARKAAEKGVRELVKAYITYNPQVTDTNRSDMGLPIHKTSHTPVPAPTTIPEGTVELPSPAVVRIHFRDKDEEGKSKPTGVHGCEIAWAVLDTPPTDWSNLIHSAFDTHTPVEFTFTGEERGKSLYFALRWENTRGVKGHWSEIQSAIIP
jgi:hypothetical protein